MTRVQVSGEVIGERAMPGAPPDLVVQVVSELRPRGPAANSVILIERHDSGAPSARYLPWVGYPDIDQAVAREFGRWRLVEPARRYDEAVVWLPYGARPLDELLVRIG